MTVHFFTNFFSFWILNSQMIKTYSVIDKPETMVSHITTSRWMNVIQLPHTWYLILNIRNNIVQVIYRAYSHIMYKLHMFYQSVTQNGPFWRRHNKTVIVILVHANYCHLLILKAASNFVAFYFITLSDFQLSNKDPSVKWYISRSISLHYLAKDFDLVK